MRTALLPMTLALALAGCVDPGGPPPARPSVNVADQVTSIDRALVVGGWQCRELNPYPNAPIVITDTTFYPDGYFTSRGTSSGQAGLPMGPTTVTTRGKWRVEESRLVTSEITAEVASGNGGSGDLLSGVLAQIGPLLGGGQSAQPQGGSSDVLELTRSTMVIKGQNIQDPPVVTCSRTS